MKSPEQASTSGHERPKTEPGKSPENSPRDLAVKRYIELSKNYKMLGLKKAQYAMQLREVEKTIPTQDENGHYPSTANISMIPITRLLAQELQKEVDRYSDEEEKAYKELSDFTKSLSPDISSTIPNERSE
jgi:chaperonin cofactor prefoldin